MAAFIDENFTGRNRAIHVSILELVFYLLSDCLNSSATWCIDVTLQVQDDRMGLGSGSVAGGIEDA